MHQHCPPFSGSWAKPSLFDSLPDDWQFSYNLGYLRGPVFARGPVFRTFKKSHYKSISNPNLSFLFTPNLLLRVPNTQQPPGPPTQPASPTRTDLVELRHAPPPHEHMQLSLCSLQVTWMGPQASQSQPGTPPRHGRAMRGFLRAIACCWCPPHPHAQP